ncbi:MAG TPA: CHAT domain-containing protein [Cyclobacteriaceae bacterium]|nr:CHAT domain-containing protein [Cyclobacteriaceae bacterium]
MKINIFMVWMAVCSLITPLFGQSKWDKSLAKVEAAYAMGSYQEASTLLEKFKKKVNSKLGPKNPYTHTIYFLQAKYALAIGMPTDFESNMQLAIDACKAAYGESAEQVGAMLMDAADLYNQNGSFRVAHEYLDRSRSTLETAGSWKDPLKANWEIIRAETLTGQGYYRESLKIILERLPYYAKRAIKQETVADGKGGLKSRKIPEAEVAQRYDQYARVLTLLANTYGKQGNLRTADSAFVFAQTWIQKNLGNRTLAYARNQLYNANVLVENGNQVLPKDLDYERTLLIIKSFYNPAHTLGIQTYEAYLKSLMREDLGARYYNVKQEYEKLIDKEFPKKSIFNVRFKAVEFDTKLTRDKTKNLETSALSVINNTPELPHNNLLTADILDFLVDLDIAEKKYTSVEGYLKDIIAIKSDLYGADAPETHLASLRLANYYLDYTNNITDAGKIYEASYTNVVSKEIGAWHKDHLNILNHLAVYYELSDQYAKAIATSKKAGLVARGKYDDKDYQYGEELTRIARLQIRLGQYEEAEKSINQALTILEEFRKEPTRQGLLVEAIDTRATLYGIKGLFDEANDELDRSAKIIRNSEIPLGIDDLSTAQNLSSLFIQLGLYSETGEILDKLIAEYEKVYGNQSLRLIEPLVNKGKLLLAQGDYPTADKIALRANTIATSIYGEISTKTAATQKLLGDIDYTIGDYDKAEDNILKALKSQEKQFGRNHIDVAKSLGQLALIKFYKGDNRQEVEKIMIEARDIIGAKLGKDNPQYADILKNVATVYIAEKRFDVAFNSLTQAETIWRTKTGTKNSIQAASIYALTGDVYYQLKNYVKAEEFYKKGKDLYDKFFSDRHPEYVRILSKMARVYYMQKDYKSSKKNIEKALDNYEQFIKQYFPALSEREKAKYWNTIKGDFEFYNTLAFSQLEDFRDLSGKVYNYQLLTKALLLSSSIKIRERILKSKDENLIASYTSWVQKKEALTAALSMSTQQLTDNGIDPVAMGNEVERLERELSEKSEIFGQGFENKKITYEQVQSALGKNDVAMEMVRYRYFNHSFTDSVIYVALYLKGGGRPKVVELPEGHRMETRYFRYYRNSITGKIKDEYSYKVFWEPIQKEIGQYATIYISPDGVYNQINLEAIPTPDGKYVIDNSNIVIVSNTKDLYLRKLKAKLDGKKQVKNASMFGNPNFYVSASARREYSELPGTEKEVNELQQLLKEKGWLTDEYMENAATEEQVKALDNPRIFHIATHGFYSKADADLDQKSLTGNEAMMAENPLMKSGLLLRGGGDILARTRFNFNIDNGILTAYEAMNLNLENTDLVVLSACETGLGEIANGEGVYGLQRAFFVAGAKVLIMSMFKVDDDATQKLILNFYRKWLNTGNMRQSFVEAKKELRTEYADPIYWGAFMMIGQD